MAKNSSKLTDKNASKPTRAPKTPAPDRPASETAAMPHAPWFLFSIRFVAVGLLASLLPLLWYGFRLGPMLGWYQTLIFLIYSVATLVVACIGLGVPFRFFVRAGKRVVNITTGEPR